MALSITLVILIFVDAILNFFTKKKIIKYQHKSIFILLFKSLFSYGLPWNYKRFANLIGTIYGLILIIVGFIQLGKQSIDPDILTIHGSFIMFGAISFISAVKFIFIRKVDIAFNICQIIYGSFLFTGIVGSVFYLHEVFGYSYNTSFWYLMVIPLANILFKKVISTIDQAQQAK